MVCKNIELTFLAIFKYNIYTKSSKYIKENKTNYTTNNISFFTCEKTYNFCNLIF